MRFSLRSFALLALAGISVAFIAGPARADHSRQASQLITMLAKHDYAGAEKTFDDTMKKAMPASKLKTVWEGQIVAQAGAFQKQGAAKSQTVQQGGQSYEAVIIHCQFARAPLDAQVVYNSQGQVAGLFFKPVQP